MDTTCILHAICFNPLPSPKQGETQNCGRAISAVSAFQSAPLTKARGDSAAAALQLLRDRFNPLPSPKQGETCGVRGVAAAVDPVSIRSPHQSKGRLHLSQGIHLRVLFQSAPLTKARGDLHALLPGFPDWLFQSAPLTKARGDATPPTGSEHASEFQSAPLTKARGDRPGCPVIRASERFQSAPLTKARGDWYMSGAS